MNELLLVGELLLFVVLFAGFLTIPQWVSRRSSRYALWGFRDQVALELASGVGIPRCDQSVRLLAEIERSIDAAPRLTLSRLLIFRMFLVRGMSPESVTIMAERHSPDLSDLDPDSAELIRKRYARLNWLETRLLVTGSWLGLMVVAMAFALAIMKWTFRKDGGIRSTARNIMQSEMIDQHADVLVATVPARVLPG